MNTLKKLFIFAAVTCQVITLVSTLAPQKVSAAPTSVYSDARNEYKATVAYGVLMACVGDAKISKSEYNKAEWGKNSFVIPGASRDGGMVVVGSIWEGNGSDGKIDCDTSGGSMEKVVQALGFDSMRDFNEAVAPRTGDNSTCKGEDVCPFLDGWPGIVAARATSKGVSGPDYDVRKLSDSGRYYFWTEVFTRFCKGTFNVTDDRFNSEPTDKTALGPYFIVNNETGTVEEKKYSFFQVSQSQKVEDIGFNYDKGPVAPDEGEPQTFEAVNCGDVAAHMKNKALADGFAALFAAKKQECAATSTTCNDSDILGLDAQGDSGTSVQAETCESANIVAVAWILCPIIGGIDEAVNRMGAMVEDMLTVGSDTYDKPELKAVWSYFRVLATFLLIAIGLVMVISQAISVGPFDAYTVKKVFPRLVIGVIAIQLSWYLFVALIQITNSIAWGIQDLMYAPFGGSANFDFKAIINESNFGVAGLFTFASIGFAAGAISLGIFGALSFAFTALLGILIAFILLGFRRLILVALLLVSPIALVAWILPNTEKVWKVWWESFSKLLLMYPMIIFIVAAGRIFAWTAGNVAVDSTGGFTSDKISDFTVFLAVVFGYFGPYFLIPKTFQLAGSAFGNIAGIANDRSRGVFDRLRKGRQERMSDRFSRAQDNHLWNEKNPNTLRGRVVGKANTLASIATSNPWDTARLYAKTAGGKGVMSQITQAKYQDTQKLASALQDKGITIDRGLQALAGNHDRFRDKDGNHRQIHTQRDLEDAIAALDAGDDQDRAAAQQLRSASSFITSIHDNPEYGRGSLQGAALMNWSAQGFADADRIESVANGLGGEFGTLVGQQAAYLGYKNGGRLDLKPTYGLVSGQRIDENGKSVDGNVVRAAGLERQKKLVTGLKQYEWSSAKGAAVEKLGAAITAVVADGGDKGYTMAQTVAANAMSATDPASKAEWRKIAGDIFQTEVAARGGSTDEALDAILYEKAYGRGQTERTIDDSRTAGPGGGAPGPGGPGDGPL